MRTVIPFIIASCVNVIGILWTLILLLGKLDNPDAHTWTAVGTPVTICSIVALLIFAVGVILWTMED